MSKVPIHFIGFLANADHSIGGLRMGEGFAIEHKSKDDVAPFLREIDKYYGLRTRFGFLSRPYCCVLKADIARFEGTPTGGVVIRPNVLDHAHQFVRDKCRLLRLFKEGNIVLAHALLYHLADTDKEAKPFGFVREYPILDTTQFTLMTNELSEAESFIQTNSLPLAKPSLQLAFESFEQSYEVQDSGLAFLSLMIAMEVLLNPSDRELRYRVSRNAAVLLGEDQDAAQVIFKEIKALYDKRSKLVHTGDNSLVLRADVLKLRDYVRRTIKEIHQSSKSKDELLTLLNTCGFGQRPWRGALGLS